MKINTVHLTNCSVLNREFRFSQCKFQFDCLTISLWNFWFVLQINHWSLNQMEYSFAKMTTPSNSVYDHGMIKSRTKLTAHREKVLRKVRLIWDSFFSLSSSLFWLLHSSCAKLHVLRYLALDVSQRNPNDGGKNCTRTKLLCVELRYTENCKTRQCQWWWRQTVSEPMVRKRPTPRPQTRTQFVGIITFFTFNGKARFC